MWMSFWTMLLIGVMIIYGGITIWVAISGIKDIGAMLKSIENASDQDR